MTAESINIDGKDYNVLVVYPSRERTVELRDGPLAGKALSHRKIRDLEGAYLGYSMTIKAHPEFQSEYDALYEVLKTPVEYHKVVMPFAQGTIEFDAAIYRLHDIDYGVKGSERRWSDLTVILDPMEPQWRP